MSALVGLAEDAGVQVRWKDAHGHDRTVGEETLRAILGLLGIEAGSEAKAEDALEARRAARGSPPLLVVKAGRRPRLALDAVLARRPFVLDLEDGARREGLLAPGGGEGVVLPLDLPLGRHVLRVGDDAIPLAACPPKAPQPADLGFARAWGMGVQLYGLRGRPNDDGIGDFALAGSLAADLGGRGADFLGLNPLHALFPAAPGTISPYAPSSRRFLNWLYIDLDGAARDLGLPLPDGLPAVPEGGLVDYPAVAARKRAALDSLWRAFERRPDDDPLKADFAAFRAGGGEDLHRHAAFDALQEAALAKDETAFAFWTWPKGWQDPASKAVRDFCETNPSRLGYFVFLQWLADRQLGVAQERAKGAGMRLGLYKDLAVGVNPAGSAVWARPDLTLRGVSIGAPPDIFNPKGQVWGLAPYSPTALAGAGFAPLVADLAANMRHAGAVRVDHVIGLMRQWWVPDGMGAGEGAYVRFPFQDIARLIALEARRANCLVIGEDLGTVPEGFDRAMRGAGMLSCKVFWFERKGKGLKAPEAYKPLALTSLSTHDLPTLAGYWRGEDIDLRDRLDLFPDEGQAEADRKERRRDKARIVQGLAKAGVAEDGTNEPEAAPEPRAEADEALLLAAHRYLARTPSALVMLQAEDAILQTEQANLPGTIDEHPNWRRRLPVPVDGLAAASTVRPLLAMMAKERPR
ncbi:MAG: 4-alpha-glucanotransferase [Geminicoccaceae bacterium]|nr:4-alpha-glucanotransferase [Geminicoccaceae bacterium]